MDQPVPVHLAGVVTGQSRGSYLLGAIVFVIGLLLLGFIWMVVLLPLANSLNSPIIRSYVELGFLAMIIPVLAMVMSFVHGMSLRDLMAPSRPVDWGMAGRSALVYAIPLITVILIGLLAGEVTIDRSFSLGHFLMLAPLTAGFFMLQASAEELLFRGYLAQGAQVLFRHVVPSALLTAVLFTLAHEGSGDNAVWARRIDIFMMALMLSWLTARLGRLEAAMGAHIINNVVVTWFHGSPSISLPGIMTAVDINPPDPVGIEWLWLIAGVIATIGFYWLVGVRTGFVERGLSPRQT